MKPDRLAKLGLRSRLDFVLHLPMRYEDETQVFAPRDAPPGRDVLIDARVERAQIAYRGSRQLIVHADGVVLKFFHPFPNQLTAFKRAIEEGRYVRAFGEIRRGLLGAEMTHPRYRFVAPGCPPSDTWTPVYPSTAKVPQHTVRTKVLQALDAGPLEDTLPPELRSRYALEPFEASVRLLHRPPPGIDMGTLVDRTHPAWRRVKFDELLAQQLSLRLAYRARRRRRAQPLRAGALANAFMRRLPFKLTRAQVKAINEVSGDIVQDHPMQRLLQGDVGSGKTIVAAIACLAAADSDAQAAVMAPTEILSEQHFRKFSEWLAPLGVKIAWLHGGLSSKEKKQANAAIASGDAQIVVGTHALVQKGVEFARLGLAVVDEQHRFGVQQRLTLRRKGEDAVPHQLMMSATPIPRTLSMTYFADLDVSVIDEMPPGRRKVSTKLISAARRGEVLERIRAECAEGRQVFWVCPVIEESKEGDVQTALDTHALLSREMKDLRVGLVHGRLQPDEKAAAMGGFLRGETQLLVCTTVIEVGVDVPNASLMVIESAERFGLAQLHQLRGRIGRGGRKSTCVLLYGEPLSDTARERLKAIYENADGFAVAELDLKLRKPGDFLGERQSGQPLLRFADLERDGDLVAAAIAAAAEMLERHPAAARAHVERWLGSRKDLSGS